MEGIKYVNITKSRDMRVEIDNLTVPVNNTLLCHVLCIFFGRWHTTVHLDPQNFNGKILAAAIGHVNGYV